MWQILKTINQNLVAAIPAMMLLGFGFGLTYDPSILKSLIVPLTFVMVYPMMVSLKIKQVFAGGDSRAQLLAQLINFGIVPFAAFGVGLYFLQDQPYMALGLLLAGLVPTSGMTISWTGLARGNMAAAVKMTVIGLTLGSLATPLYVQFLLGAQIEVDIAAVVRQILLIVFLPMAAGFATQQLLIKKVGRLVCKIHRSHFWNAGRRTCAAPEPIPPAGSGPLGIIWIISKTIAYSLTDQEGF